MKKKFLQNHHADFKDKLQTFIQISAHNNDENAPDHFCFFTNNEKVANLQAINFDEIREKWYPDHKEPQPNNVPCSVDALLFEEKGIYLIEFKSGHAEKVNLFRKIYDSIMMLIEKDKLTFEKSRKECTYIVVSNLYEPWDNRTKAIVGSLISKKNPWKELITRLKYDQLELEKLEGVLVSSSYLMPSKLFELFVKYEKWQ